MKKQADVYLVNQVSRGKLWESPRRRSSPIGFVVSIELSSPNRCCWRQLQSDCCLVVLAMSETESMIMGEEEDNRSNPTVEATAETTMNDDQQSYSWPVIQFNSPPRRTYHFYNQFRTCSNPNNFFKGVKWYIACVFLSSLLFILLLLLFILLKFCSYNLL